MPITINYTPHISSWNNPDKKDGCETKDCCSKLTKENVAFCIHPHLSNPVLDSHMCTKKISEELQKEFTCDVFINSSVEEQIKDLVVAFKKGIKLETVSEKILELVQNNKLSLTNLDFGF